MSNPELLPLSAFEWASATKYIVYVSTVACLFEINSNHVNSFPLARLGTDKLHAQKKKVRGHLEQNMQKLEQFVGSHEDTLEDAEMSIIRSLYVQYKGQLAIVREHIGAVVAFRASETLGLFGVGGEGDDDIPF